ncbi:chromate resistance protein ChrB domain-containing protein [Mesorhizobium sp. ZC-5]|uniref:chromate resistance protein ChrB domain-containing protein n=1 Tax=Mesorhizobium sp. ZC-5 TaxID=2986066 RepID=UPI0021E7D911|nr:sulfurtransferase/chromate resistance protein [Mesorhizobium sp. ZC-5]MCV3241893.1 chromate resistance protein [Mesorhizobium sp. ZC-5]
MPRRLLPEQLIPLVGTSRCPLLVDVRRAAALSSSPVRIAGAIWRDHMKTVEWLPQLPEGQPVVVYCTHGHNVSEIAASYLAAAGCDVAMLDGGIEAWVAAGGPTVICEASGLETGLPRPSVWVTRERPKIDRIACPWLIRRFIDPLAVFHFVAAEWVKDIADETGWIAYDIKDVFYSHRGETCTFDTLISEFGLTDPALLHLANIVRGADTARLDLEPQAAGLLAISLGLSAIEEDDPTQLEKGMVIYDALYGWCRYATAETHNWPARAA